MDYRYEPKTYEPKALKPKTLRPETHEPNRLMTGITGTLPLTFDDFDWDLSLTISRYDTDNTLCIDAWCDNTHWSWWACLTICLGIELPDRWAFVDDQRIPGLRDTLVKAGLARHTNHLIRRGFHTFEAMEFTDLLFDIAPEKPRCRL